MQKLVAGFLFIALVLGGASVSWGAKGASKEKATAAKDCSGGTCSDDRLGVTWE